MPIACKLWFCRWLINDDAADLRRPDRSHYVIDLVPDFVDVEYDNGDEARILVVQIWVDPSYPEAWRDPTLLAYLERRGEQNNYAAIIRTSSYDDLILIPPAMNPSGKFIELKGSRGEGTHSMKDIMQTVEG